MSNPFDQKVNDSTTLSFSTKDQYGRTTPKAIGTRLGGTLAKDPEVVQSRFYEGPDKGKPMFWHADGGGKKTAMATTEDGRTNNPVRQIVCTFAGAGDEGKDGSLWVSYYPKDMYEAIQEALADNAPQKGDELWVILSGMRAIPGKNPAYTYKAEFTKRAGAFSVPTTVTAPPPPAAAVTPAPPAPTATTEPILSNGFTASQLVAAGWTADQIAALSAPAAPPAPPASPADKMAGLSDEDKAMLNLV